MKIIVLFNNILLQTYFFVSIETNILGLVALAHLKSTKIRILVG